MVIPWVGFPLAEVLKRVEPQGSAKYVAFETLVRPVRDAGPARPVPGAALALRRGPAPRRGHAPAHHPRGRPLRRDAAQPERRADPAGGAVEVRLQEHQVDRAHQPHRQASRRSPGRSRTPASTASIPTSTRRSIIRAGARRPSGASARAGCWPSDGRRCRSTATAIRSRASTRAWISKPTTEMARRRTRCLASTAPAGRRPDPARHLHRRHAAGGLVLLSRHHRPARRRSAEHAGAAARAVGAAVPDPVAGHHAAAAPRRPQSHPLSPRDRAARLLLRGAASHGLHGARPGPRLRRHLGRHRQAALHHGRHVRVHHPRAAGRHLQQRHDPPAGRQRLAATASPRLRGGRGRRHPFRHGGQGLAARAADLCRHRCHPAAVPALAVRAEEAASPRRAKDVHRFAPDAELPC